MSTASAPFGMLPSVKQIGAGYSTQGFNQYPVASGYATAMYAGDIIKPLADGTVGKDTGTTTLTPLGVAVGFSYTDPVTGQFLTTQYYPGNVAAADIMAWVADDPTAVFLIQANGPVNITHIGNNAGLLQSAGSALFGKSRIALDATTIATTATLPLRILGIDPRPDNAAGDAYTNVLVKFNTHQHLVATGI